MILHESKPPAEWGRDDIEHAIKCIRKIHRHGQVLNLWNLALLIYHENEWMTSTLKEISAFSIHVELVDIFTRFESCRKLSLGMDPSLHDRVTAQTAPYTVREVIIRKFGWYYELLAVLGKQIQSVQKFDKLRAAN